MLGLRQHRWRARRAGLAQQGPREAFMAAGGADGGGRRGRQEPAGGRRGWRRPVRGRRGWRGRPNRALWKGKDRTVCGDGMTERAFILH